MICPGGMGRRLPLHSWGYRGQITDLARMHEIARRTLPWLRIDQRRIYALGGSMGGQETLLLLGQHPQLLAGAVAFDSVTNFYRRYNDFAITPGRRGLQRDVDPSGGARYDHDGAAGPIDAVCTERDLCESCPVAAHGRLDVGHRAPAISSDAASASVSDPAVCAPPLYKPRMPTSE